MKTFVFLLNTVLIARCMVIESPDRMSASFINFNREKNSFESSSANSNGLTIPLIRKLDGKIYSELSVGGQKTGESNSVLLSTQLPTLILAD